MSLCRDRIPEISPGEKPRAYAWEAPADLLSRWSGIEPVARAPDAKSNVIDVLDVIGSNPWEEGVTAKGVMSALDGMKGDIRVRINSPGGDMFEGLGIYNALRAHEGKVTVNVMGIAASAASVIAMAGDEIVMGASSMMMIHNAWSIVVGNRHDMRAIADTFEVFDRSMGKLYAARMGKDLEYAASMMDAETFLEAEEAVQLGLADRYDKALATQEREEPEQAAAIMARRRLEAALARDGVPRNERASLIAQAATGLAPRDASEPEPEAGRDAGFILDAERLAALRSVLTFN